MFGFVKFKPFVNPVVSVNILFYAHHTVSLTFLTDSTKEMMQRNNSVHFKAGSSSMQLVFRDQVLLSHELWLKTIV